MTVLAQHENKVSEWTELRLKDNPSVKAQCFGDMLTLQAKAPHLFEG